jgi:hypothetical protein
VTPAPEGSGEPQGGAPVNQSEGSGEPQGGAPVNHAHARGERPPPWLRRYLAAFLTVFALCGVLGIEAWPLTGWRLFADARPAVQHGWQAVTVDHAGRETPVPFDELPIGYRGWVQVLKGFTALPAGEQAAVCRAWADAVRARGGDVAAVRVYETWTDVSRRVGRRGAAPARTPRVTCQDGAARAG